MTDPDASDTAVVNPADDDLSALEITPTLPPPQTGPDSGSTQSEGVTGPSVVNIGETTSPIISTGPGSPASSEELSPVTAPGPQTDTVTAPEDDGASGSPEIASLPDSPTQTGQPSPIAGPETSEPPASLQPTPPDTSLGQDLPFPAEFISGSDANNARYGYGCLAPDAEVLIAFFFEDRTGVVGTEEQVYPGTWALSGSNVIFSSPDLATDITISDIVFVDTYQFQAVVDTVGSVTCFAVGLDGEIYGSRQSAADSGLAGGGKLVSQVLDNLN